MHNKFENLIAFKIQAFAGYPLILYIIYSIIALLSNVTYIYGIITTIIVIPYIFLTLVISLVILFNELIQKKVKTYYEKDTLSNILFYVGIISYYMVLIYIIIMHSIVF